MQIMAEVRRSEGGAVKRLLAERRWVPTPESAAALGRDCVPGLLLCPSEALN